MTPAVVAHVQLQSPNVPHYHMGSMDQPRGRLLMVGKNEITTRVSGHTFCIGILLTGHSHIRCDANAPQQRHT